jgi:membrane-bound lytic murein transglycosylase F
VRAENRKLLGAIDEFFDQEHRGVFYNMAYRKYFKDPRRIRKHVEMRSANTGTLSPYDDLIRRYAEQYGFDWRLIVAQMFHESRLDPTAKSWAGAEGLLQVLPSTAKALGFHNLGDLETGIHAGIKYLNQLRGKLDADIPLQERTWLALAAYNAGFGHLADARRLAKRLGLDPNRWTDNVEKAMLLLSRDKYARQAKNGYCRCSEPVAYVRDIRARYDAYARTGPDQLVEKVGEPRDASVAEITESER